MFIANLFFACDGKKKKRSYYLKFQKEQSKIKEGKIKPTFFKAGDANFKTKLEETQTMLKCNVWFLAELFIPVKE